MSVVNFAIVPDPARPDCKPLATLQAMLESGALPRFAFLWGLPSRVTVTKSR